MIPESPSDETKNLPITQWPEEDRPREKMIALGKKSLTNSELVAILLRTGIPGASAIQLAQQILSSSGNRLIDLARLEVSDLRAKGIGPAKAVAVMAALELGNRMLRENVESRETVLKDSKDLFHFFASRIADIDHEEFHAVYLNQRGKVSWYQRIAEGGLTETTVDMRRLFAPAVEHRAASLAVAHNHPSGDLTPSRHDKELTRRIAEAGRILNVRLTDHIIVGITPAGRHDYFSFAENGLL
ncbi:MAG: DNA repair protein RadC [Bacteroidales bacterium]|nr:DNA repair protein RadC [Bacteroidales bacterium]